MPRCSSQNLDSSEYWVLRQPIGLPSPRSVSAPTSRLSVVELLALPVEVVDSSPVVVLASVPLPELLVVPVLELAAGSEVTDGVVVNGEVQIELGAEVVVEGTRGHAGLRSEFPVRRSAVAACRKRRSRNGEDALLRLGRIGVRWAPQSTWRCAGR